LAEVPYLAHRFKLQKFLGLTEDEILENERLWNEENDGTTEPTDSTFSDIGAKAPGESDLSLASDIDGAVPADSAGLGTDTDTGTSAAAASPISGTESTPPASV
jgi:hypothetical protein